MATIVILPFFIILSVIRQNRNPVEPTELCLCFTPAEQTVCIQHFTANSLISICRRHEKRCFAELHHSDVISVECWLHWSITVCVVPRNLAVYSACTVFVITAYSDLNQIVARNFQLTYTILKHATSINMHYLVEMKSKTMNKKKQRKQWTVQHFYGTRGNLFSSRIARKVSSYAILKLIIFCIKAGDIKRDEVQYCLRPHHMFMGRFLCAHLWWGGRVCYKCVFKTIQNLLNWAVKQLIF